MRVAIYVRVSTQRQTQMQTIEQQLDRLHAYIEGQGWTLLDHHIFRDDGYSGASLRRPGLDRLRDVVAAGAVDRVLLTAPDRLARNYRLAAYRPGVCRHHVRTGGFRNRGKAFLPIQLADTREIGQ